MKPLVETGQYFSDLRREKISKEKGWQVEQTIIR